MKLTPFLHFRWGEEYLIEVKENKSTWSPISPPVFYIYLSQLLQTDFERLKEKIFIFSFLQSRSWMRMVWLTTKHHPFPVCEKSTINKMLSMLTRQHKTQSKVSTKTSCQNNNTVQWQLKFITKHSMLIFILKRNVYKQSESKHCLGWERKG